MGFGCGVLEDWKLKFNEQLCFHGWGMWMMDPNSTLRQAMAHGVWKIDEAENYFFSTSQGEWNIVLTSRVHTKCRPSPSPVFLTNDSSRCCTTGIVLLRYKKVACTRQQDLTFLRLRYTDNFTSWCLKIYIEVLKFWHFDINAVLWLGSVLVRLGRGKYLVLSTTISVK